MRIFVQTVLQNGVYRRVVLHPLFIQGKAEIGDSAPHSSETGVTAGKKVNLNLTIHPLNPAKVKLESKKTSYLLPRACQSKTLRHQ